MKLCKKCKSKVIQLSNQPEMGDGYKSWHRYECHECGILTEEEVIKNEGQNENRTKLSGM